MRMFLICMCDIFLILYLTSITNVQPKSALTVEDFYKLNAMHETLQKDKQRSEEKLQEQLQKARQEQNTLAAKLSKEKNKLKETEQSLVLSDARREQINKDLQAKEKMLKDREQLLTDLNKEIAAKEEARRKMQSEYQNKLQSQQQTIETTQKEAEQHQAEAQEAQRLAGQMREEAALALKTAETAKTIQQQADNLKEQALKDKQAAERKAAEALAARQRAEEEKQKALEEMNAAREKKELAEARAQELARTVQVIKQDAESAYTNNILPRLQQIKVNYVREASDTRFEYERELTLLPVKLDGQVYGVFPSRQAGFYGRSDQAPDKLVIEYQGQRLKSWWMNTEDDLIAISLDGYKGEAHMPYPIELPVDQFMPVLLALRNNGDVGLMDKLRGIAEHYFIVKRDDLKMEGQGMIAYAVTGLRGTGGHGERIIRGDQLVDLNGRLIGIAGDVNRVIRLDSLSGWTRTDL